MDLMILSYDVYENSKGKAEMGQIDLKHLCHGCMRYLDRLDAPCPSCKWQMGRQNAQNQLPPGSILAGRYMTGRSLGKGGFGITYIAWDIKNQRRVAVKEFFMENASHRLNDSRTVSLNNDQNDRRLFDMCRERFVREAQNQAKLSVHPNIVRVHASFHENGTSYMVMEFVPGITMKRYLEFLRQPMLTGDAAALLRPIAHALAHIHSAGFIHRDISPDNIMFTKSGEAKLLDFGAARAFSIGSRQRLTEVFKAGYAPLEQHNEDGRQQGPWTDIYAFAATIYSAITPLSPDVTGIISVNVPTDARMRVNIDGFDVLKPPSSYGIRITPEEERVIMKGMALDYRQRYQSVREFYSELTRSVKAAKNTGGQKVVKPDESIIDRVMSFGKNLLDGIVT